MNAHYNGKFKITQGFKGSAHDGLDLVGLDSKEIHSTVNGEVVFAGWENPNDHEQGFGQYVVVQNDKQQLFHFAHLKEIKAKYVQKVKIGDVVGIEGSTGRSTGSHCHYCVRTSLSPGTFLDVCEISGIPNDEDGIYDDSNTTTKEKPKQTATEKKKPTDKIVEAVIAGDYGNGNDRKNKLEAEGYSYDEVQTAVDKKLKENKTTEDKKPVKQTVTETYKTNGHDPAMSLDESLAGTYSVTAMGGLNVRKGAGTSKERITTLPWNTVVNCYGYYTETDGVKWLLIKTAAVEGFVSSQFLARR